MFCRHMKGRPWRHRTIGLLLSLMACGEAEGGSHATTVSGTRASIATSSTWEQAALTPVAAGSGGLDAAPIQASAAELAATQGAAMQVIASSMPQPNNSADPGSAAFEEVPLDQVREQCGLDPDALARADTTISAAWAVLRHGRLCHSYHAKSMQPEDALSATKTLVSVITGMVAYQTSSLVRSGRKTGPLSDSDRVDQWLDSFTFNRDAQIGHMLGMVAQSEDLTLGHRQFVYDAFGDIQIQRLNDILNTAIAQDAARLGANLEQFTNRFLFEPLGMTQSTWSDGASDKTVPYGWNTTVFDMARLGLLILRGGMWNGQRLLDREWIYRMTHPAFEDASTGWGYLTWLNAASNYHTDGVPLPPAQYQGTLQQPLMPGPCAPVALAHSHPHGLSDSPDCGYEPPYTCSQTYDIGVWQAVGLFGQVIQGHPGLDLLIVAKGATGLDDISGLTSPAKVWDAVRPAVVLADPIYEGDERAFCAAYGRGEYAPDL